MRPGRFAAGARRGSTTTTGSPSSRKPGPSGNALTRPRRSSRPMTRIPPIVSRDTTAPTQPVVTSSRSIPGATGTSAEAGLRRDRPASSRLRGPQP